MEAAEHGGSFLCGPAGRKAKVDVTSSQARGSSALRRGLLCHERQSNQNAPGLRPDPFFGGGAYELRQKKEKRSLRIRSVLQWPWRFTNSACRPFDPTEPSCFSKQRLGRHPGVEESAGLEPHEGNSTQRTGCRARGAEASPDIGPGKCGRKDSFSIRSETK